MRVVLRSALVTVAALVALVAARGAAATPVSTSFAIVGYEYAFTSTVGSFAGNGTGNAGDTALWNARVEHDPLGSTPTYVNGGSFAMTTRSPGGHLDFATGDFAYQGGMITVVDPGAGCTNQRYRVTGTLESVTTTTTSGGSGGFSVVLTHYRYSLFGHCVIYKARVAGTVSFSY
jgi:hypothetical protein